jgi:hypothetical protein
MDGIEFEFTEDFSDVELEIDVEFETRYIKPPKTKEIAEINLKYSDAQKLSRDFRLGECNRYFVIVNGSFYFGDFIEAFIVDRNLHVKELTISTLSMNENNVDSLANLIKGNYVDQLNLIVSDYFFAHERNNLIPYIYEKLDVNNSFQLAVAGTHCKTCILETHCGKFVVIHGSANLRSSGNIEQFVIESNKELYDFNHEYQKAIIDKYKTINKSIRSKTLWQTVAMEVVQDAEQVEEEEAEQAGATQLGE